MVEDLSDGGLEEGNPKFSLCDGHVIRQACREGHYKDLRFLVYILLLIVVKVLQSLLVAIKRHVTVLVEQLLLVVLVDH